MRNEAEIRETLAGLIRQQQLTDHGTTSYKILDQRGRALAWVLGEDNRQLLLTEDQMKILADFS